MLRSRNIEYGKGCQTSFLLPTLGRDTPWTVDCVPVIFEASGGGCVARCRVESTQSAVLLVGGPRVLWLSINNRRERLTRAGEATALFYARRTAAAVRVQENDSVGEEWAEV